MQISRSRQCLGHKIGGTVLLAASRLTAACAPVAAPAANGTVGPRVYFVTPADGGELDSPVAATFAVQDFTVEPAGGAKEGHAHLHFGQGQMGAALDLAPGEHTLCPQAADGNHIALAGEGMAQTHAPGRGEL